MGDLLGWCNDHISRKTLNYTNAEQFNKTYSVSLLTPPSISKSSGKFILLVGMIKFGNFSYVELIKDLVG